MEYRRKVAVLSGLIAALALAYTATVVFDPARTGARSDVYLWLDPRDTGRITGITVTPPQAAPYETVVLTRRGGGHWYVSRDGRDYPARQARVDDFILELTRRAAFPVRATSTAAHARLSLTEDTAYRVTVSGGMGPPLLDLLVGQADASGRNLYMRRAGRNEVRSGEDRLSAYIGAERSQWYNLRLIRDDGPGVADVLRITVYPPAGEDGETAVPMVFTRAARTWELSFDPPGGVNAMRVDAYVRDILNSHGEGFADAAVTAVFDDSRIMLELGDGSVKAVYFGPPDNDGRRLATVPGTDGPVYTVSGWTHRRLFPDPDTFGH